MCWAKPEKWRKLIEKVCCNLLHLLTSPSARADAVAFSQIMKNGISALATSFPLVPAALAAALATKSGNKSTSCPKWQLHLQLDSGAVDIVLRAPNAQDECEVKASEGGWGVGRGGKVNANMYSRPLNKATGTWANLLPVAGGGWIDKQPEIYLNAKRSVFFPQP